SQRAEPATHHHPGHDDQYRKEPAVPHPTRPAFGCLLNVLHRGHDVPPPRSGPSLSGCSESPGRTHDAVNHPTRLATLAGVTITASLHVIRAGLVDLTEAWQEQRRLHEAESGGTGPPAVLTMVHLSVY